MRSHIFSGKILLLCECYRFEFGWSIKCYTLADCLNAWGAANGCWFDRRCSHYVLCANLSLLFCHLAQPLHSILDPVSKAHIYTPTHVRVCLWVCACVYVATAAAAAYSESDTHFTLPARAHIVEMFGFHYHFHWMVCCCCCCCRLFWLPFATIETCVNRILTSIMLISSRVRKANGYLIICERAWWMFECLGFLLCFHKQWKHLKLLDDTEFDLMNLWIERESM